MFLKLKNSSFVSRKKEEVDTDWKYLVDIDRKETQKSRTGSCKRLERKYNYSIHWSLSIKNESFKNERATDLRLDIQCTECAVILVY